MASIYEIEFRYDDEYKANKETHNAFVCVYETGTAEGDTIQQAQEWACEDGDYAGLDKLLENLFSLKDDDICFYFDITDIKDTGTSRLTKLVPELQKSFGIVINDIWLDRVSKE